jgi:hypothetical protein
LHFIFFELELNLADVKDELKFLLRLNRLLAPIVLAAFAGVNYLVWRDLQKTYDDATVEIARVMLETAHAMRAYTTQEIAPLLEGDPALSDRAAKRIHEILGADLPKEAQRRRAGGRVANAGPQRFSRRRDRSRIGYARSFWGRSNGPSRPRPSPPMRPRGPSASFARSFPSFSTRRPC